MKNYKLPLMGFALLLFITSCKKEDVQPSNTSKTTSASMTSGSWNSLANWSTVKMDDTTTAYFSKISDSAINSSVAKSGLVLVFKKNGSDIQSLPFQDRITGTYWFYQVSKGLVQINGTSNGSQKNFTNQAFSYFVLSPQQISDMESKGKTKLDLMQLTYQQALALFK